MDLIKNLVNLFTDTEYECDERFDLVEIKAQTKTLHIPERKTLVDILKRFPERDIVYVYIETNGDASYKLNSQDNDSMEHFYDDLENVVILADPSNIQTLRIDINKSEVAKGEISIYSLDALTKYLLRLPLRGIICSFNEVFTRAIPIYFELQENIDSFYSKTFLFKKKGESINETIINVDQIIEQRNLICTFLNASETCLIPDCFSLIKRSSNTEFNKLMDKLTVLFSLIYISNFSQLVDDSTLAVKIDGYKLIANSLQLDGIREQLSGQLFDIYKWIYTEGNLSDKAGLSRNILSIHIADSNIMTLEGDILPSIKSSHEIYLKQNVQQYIDIKNKVAEFLFDMTQKSSNITESFINSFKRNLLGIMTFFVTVIVMNSLSDKKLKNIFTKDITVISYALLTASVVLLVFSIIEVIVDYNKFKKNYFRLKDNYCDILNRNDIRKIFKRDKYHKQDLSYIRKKVIAYSVLWISIVIIIFIVVLILRVKELPADIHKYVPL